MPSMRILVISQFFHPEMGAPAARFFDFAKYWIKTGHNVEVITAFPNFPDGVIPGKYRKKLFMVENLHGIRVYRGYIWADSRLRFVDKVLGYIIFAISATFIVLFADLKYDLVISTSPPPSVGIPGILASVIRRTPFIFDVRDIWPEGPTQSGRIRNHFLVRLCEWMEMAIYRRAKIITVVTNGKRVRLAERGVPEEKIQVITNGVDTSLFDQESDQSLPEDLERLFHEYPFCLTYAGVLNPPQGLDIILDCAVRLRDRRPDIYNRMAFVLIGDGSRRKHLEKRAQKEKLDCVHFMGIRPRPVVFAVLRKSFANIVTLRRRGDSHTVPSKIYEALASGRPVLVSAAGEPVDIVLRANGGSASPPEDPDALCTNVIHYIENPGLAEQHGKSARAYCELHFDRYNSAVKFERILTGLISS